MTAAAHPNLVAARERVQDLATKANDARADYEAAETVSQRRHRWRLYVDALERLGDAVHALDAIEVRRPDSHLPSE